MAARVLPAEAKSATKFDLHLGEIANVFLGFFGIRTETEMPFQSLLEDGAFSVRNYQAHSEIRNEEVGTRKEAVNKSFGRLFGYIQGQNWEDQKFAMTTPVIQRSSGDARWTTSFFMQDAIENLPLPKASAVKLYGVTNETMAVLRFTGRPTDAAVKEQIGLLREWIRDRDLTAVGEPEVAQFDQPFSIPFLRRNEIRIPIETL